MGGHPDHADGAGGQEGKCHAVVAAVDLVALGGIGDHDSGLARVSGRVLESDDVGGVAGELQEAGRADLAASAYRDVVDDHR